MSIETLRDRIDYLEKEWAKEKAENAELKKTISKLLSDLAESDNKRGARETGLVEKNAELKDDIRFLLDQINKAERNNGFWFSSNDLDKLRDIESKRATK